MTEPLRLLVLVGTDFHPFPRFVRALDEWAAAQDTDKVRCFIQHGATEAPTRTPASAFLDHDDLQRRLKETDIVVCHGGPSTITEARQHGIRPVVMPRLERLGEQVDNHQLRFVRRLSGSDMVWMVDDVPDLLDMLGRVLADPAMVELSEGDEPANVEAVRRFGDLVSGLFDEPTDGDRRSDRRRRSVLTRLLRRR